MVLSCFSGRLSLTEDKFLPQKGFKVLEEAVHRNGGVPIRGEIENLSRSGAERHGLVVTCQRSVNS